MKALAQTLVVCLLLSSARSMSAFSLGQNSQNQPQSPTPPPSQIAEPVSANQSTPQTKAAPAAKPCDSSQKPAAGQLPCNATKPKKNRRSKPAAPASSDSKKKVVRNGGTSEPSIQLAPEVSQNQASQQSQTTTQLLANTDANLKQAEVRSLTAEQQDTVKQVKDYVGQARAAVTEGDVQRAYNLALKANMLSADLVSH